MPPEPRPGLTGRRDLSLIVSAWLVAQIVSFLALGVRHGGDTGRYLTAAQELLGGGIPQGKAASYLGYDLYVTAVFGAGLGEYGIVIGQCFLALVATLCLYGIADATYGRRAALFAALLMGFWPDLQRWNFYILTDSLFVSASVIAAWCVLNPHGARWPRWLAPLAVVFAASVRPNGVVLLLAVGVYFAWRLWTARRYQALAGVGVIAAIALPVLYLGVNIMLAQEQLIGIYTKGEVIWGYEALRHSFPGATNETGGPQGLGGLASFALAYPGYFFMLFVAKVYHLYLHARPYYSAYHNFFALTTLMPLYLIALRGAVLPVQPTGARTWFGALVLGQTLVIGFTFADWDGRDLLVILPAVFLFAAAGMSRFFESGRSRGVSINRMTRVPMALTSDD